jgi:putative membrane-bound dehydrogenase-like protein
MRAWSICLLVASLTVLSSFAAAADQLSVLFLGDKGHHQPEQRFGWIKAPLAERGIAVSYTENLNELTTSNLAKYDVLLVYANIGGVSPEQEKAILDYVASGKGFMPVHCASACFGKNPELIKLMGGRFKSHGTEVFKAMIADREHPTMRGFSGFDTWDETYVHDQHNEIDRTVLMYRVTKGKNEREPWTWVRTHGQGRVFYTASGHDERTWSAPAFVDLMARGVAWAAGGKGMPVLTDLQGPFAKTQRAPLQYEERATVQNYEKRSPAPKYQLPLSPTDSQDYTKTEQGFDLTLMAAEPQVVKPIAFTWDHRGRLWVAESVDYPSKYTDLWQGNDRIKICEDTNGDGKLDKFTIFADKLNIPTGLVFANGGLIVSQAPQMLFFKDTNGDDQADVREVMQDAWSKGDTHAGPSNLRYGLDNQIYGSVGYSGFNGKVGGKSLNFRSGLFRMSKTGDRMEFLSQFNNNTWGLGISETGELFGSTANNTQHCYTPIPIPYFDATPGLAGNEELRRAVRMDQQYYANPLTDKIRQVDVFDGYTAAAGSNLYTARSFPPRYWNASVLLTEPTMHLLHQGLLKRDGSGWTEDVDGGNLVASADEWFAPVHAEVGPDGAVWIADWYNFIIQHNPTPRKEHGGFDTETGKGGAHVNPLRDTERGRVYRIAWKGAKPAKRTALDPANTTELVAALSDDNQFWRLTAQRLLVERAKTDVVPALIALAKDQTVDAIGLNGGVVHALWTLHGLGALDGSNAEALAVAVAALRHPSHGVRRNAVQVLPATSAAAAAVAAAGILNDKELNVRLAAYLAVSKLPANDEIGAQLFAQRQLPDVRGDKYLPTALLVGVSAHGRGYLAASAKAGEKLPVTAPTAPSAPVNLIKDPGFDTANGERPDGWEVRTYGGKAAFAVVDGGRSGKCLQISSTEGSDASFTVIVPVKPNGTYRLTGWIKTKDVKGAMGALFNLHGSDDKSKAVSGTKDWTKITLEFKAGGRKQVEINCLFGGWGAATGTAWWDDVELEERALSGKGASFTGRGNEPGEIEQLIGRNLAHRAPTADQLAILNQLAAGDAGTAEAVIAGLADGWGERDLPADIGAPERQALGTVAVKLTPTAQISLGGIAKRWSGEVTKAKTATGPALPAEELKRFESGRNRYQTLCIACHQANGQGLPGLAPSLVKSEWVQGPASRPVRIVLHGLQGPITVNGAMFVSPVVMPPQKDVLDDVAISEVLTYVRNEWGNQATPVQPAEVKAIRDEEAKRTQPWSAEELMKLK